MDISYLSRGLIMGFSIAAPVGPIGVLCIRRTLAEGRLIGFISGLGAATADGIYGCIAGFGLTFISSFFVTYQIAFRLIGGLFILYLGLKIFLAKPAERAATATGKSLIGAYLSTLFLTITNPLTILAFAAIFAGLGVASASHYADTSLLVLGVFLGSTLWWLLLSSSVSLFRTKLNTKALQWVNRISGIIILAFGIVALFSLTD